MSGATLDTVGVVVVCQDCGQRNRLQYGRVTAETRCGKCKAALGPPAEPMGGWWRTSECQRGSGTALPRLLPTQSPSNIYPLSREAPDRADCRCGGVPPHFFSFSADVCRRASGSDSRSCHRAWIRASGSQADRNVAASHPAGAGRSSGQPPWPGSDGRRLCGDQPVTRTIPRIQSDGRPALCVGSLLARVRTAAPVAGALAAFRRAARPSPCRAATWAEPG